MSRERIRLISTAVRMTSSDNWEGRVCVGEESMAGIKRRSGDKTNAREGGRGGRGVRRVRREGAGMNDG